MREITLIEKIAGNHESTYPTSCEPKEDIETFHNPKNKIVESVFENARPIIEDASERSEIIPWQSLP